MPNTDFPVLDGIAPSWADIKVTLSGSGLVLLDMRDIAAINTGRTVEVGEQRAPSGQVIKTTSGSLSSEASWTLYRSGFQKMLRTLGAAAPVRGNQRLVSLVHFNIQIMHTPPGDVEIYERRIKGCRYLTDGLNGAEGTDADKVEISLHTKQIADVIEGVEYVML
jgi:hypothetical protein